MEGALNMATSYKDEFPLIVSPIGEWEEYAATHPPLNLPGPTSECYPAIDGDALQVECGPLARTSVIGETTLWEKVSK